MKKTMRLVLVAAVLFTALGKDIINCTKSERESHKEADSTQIPQQDCKVLAGYTHVGDVDKADKPAGCYWEVNADKADQKDTYYNTNSDATADDVDDPKAVMLCYTKDSGTDATIDPCKCKEQWSQRGYYDKTETELCLEVKGCPTEDCAGFGEPWCEVNDPVKCVDHDNMTRKIVAWGYCSAEAPLPAGCVCMERWSDGLCEVADTVYEGCPVESCDQATTNDPTPWCHVKPSTDCPLWGSEPFDIDFGGHYMHCAGCCYKHDEPDCDEREDGKDIITTQSGHKVSQKHACEIGTKTDDGTWHFQEDHKWCGTDGEGAGTSIDTKAKADWCDVEEPTEEKPTIACADLAVEKIKGKVCGDDGNVDWEAVKGMKKADMDALDCGDDKDCKNWLASVKKNWTDPDSKTVESSAVMAGLGVATIFGLLF